MSNEPRFLVVDGYLKKSRDELAAGGAGVAGDLYGAMLKKRRPDPPSIPSTPVMP
jgi:GMP synthase (glutamine-hydrolysing)